LGYGGLDGKERRLMRTVLEGGLSLFFDEEDQEAATLIGNACEKSVKLIRTLWPLDTPEDCRVYVMTSWLGFVFRSAPMHWRILLGITTPLWYFRARKIWRYAGGWAQAYGKRRAVGVKPPRLIQSADSGIGDRIFTDRDLNEKVEHLTCHELVHAFAAHLKLPMWLNEGLAMLTVDRYHGRPTVKQNTIASLRDSSFGASPGTYRKARVGDTDALVRHYVRAYWLVRFIEETNPALMKDLLSKRCSHRALEEDTARALGMSYEQFWQSIDARIFSHFSQAKGGGESSTLLA
jgi:hypothetical protein